MDRLTLGWAALAGLSRPLLAWPAGLRAVLCALARAPVSKIEILFCFPPISIQIQIRKFISFCSELQNYETHFVGLTIL
jgi:hypothetical protein